MAPKIISFLGICRNLDPYPLGRASFYGRILFLDSSENKGKKRSFLGGRQPIGRAGRPDRVGFSPVVGFRQKPPSIVISVPFDFGRSMNYL